MKKITIIESGKKLLSTPQETLPSILSEKEKAQIQGGDSINNIESDAIHCTDYSHCGLFRRSECSTFMDDCGGTSAKQVSCQKVYRW